MLKKMQIMSLWEKPSNMQSKMQVKYHILIIAAVLYAVFTLEGYCSVILYYYHYYLQLLELSCCFTALHILGSQHNQHV